MWPPLALVSSAAVISSSTTTCSMHNWKSFFDKHKKKGSKGYNLRRFTVFVTVFQWLVRKFDIFATAAEMSKSISGADILPINSNFPMMCLYALAWFKIDSLSYPDPILSMRKFSWWTRSILYCDIIMEPSNYRIVLHSMGVNLLVQTYLHPRCIREYLPTISLSFVTSIYLLINLHCRIEFKVLVCVAQVIEGAIKFRSNQAL